MPELQLLALVVPDSLKDDVVDALIALPYLSGFNHSIINGHSREHGSFNVREQVEGSQQLIRFEILHESSDQQQLMHALQPICGPNHLRYWVVPVVDSGHFS